MRYALLIYTPENGPAPMPQPQLLEAYGQAMESMRSGGALQGGERLRFTGEAASVRVRNGSTLVTDGPFAETKEALGGFFLVDVKDRAEAVAYAAKIPGALHGTVEVRPIWEMA
jgi:hypothetical protein